ncbi:MAG: PglD-related sugar-binding protein [Alphaproteobacteria bacterium]
MAAPDRPLTAMACLLIGAGGHAKAVAEAAEASLGHVVAYIDLRPADWLKAAHLSADTDVKTNGIPVVIGVGGVTAAQLKARLALLNSYLGRGHPAPAIVHPRAHVSPSARLEAGAIVLAGAVVQPGAVIGRGAIVNTRAIVEHDSTIGEGSHVAPGSVILGGCRVGRCVMIGAGAVVLSSTVVADGMLVPALTRHGGKP